MPLIVTFSRRVRAVSLATVAAAFAAAPGVAVSADPAATVITLTQTGCQFLETEKGIDHGFNPAHSDDCRKINAATGSDRVKAAEVLMLKPGKYVFRVHNNAVPYEVGFWVRESDFEFGNPLHKLTKTSVSGGGLSVGVTKDYEVELKEGEYFYSCPLNPTPDYRIIVGG